LPNAVFFFDGFARGSRLRHTQQRYQGSHHIDRPTAHSVLTSPHVRPVPFPSSSSIPELRPPTSASSAVVPRRRQGDRACVDPRWRDPARLGFVVSEDSSTRIDPKASGGDSAPRYPFLLLVILSYCVPDPYAFPAPCLCCASLPKSASCQMQSRHFLLTIDKQAVAARGLELTKR
jgi:hypothetical protein